MVTAMSTDTTRYRSTFHVKSQPFTDKYLSESLTQNDYLVGWICALPLEAAAATAQVHF